MKLFVFLVFLLLCGCAARSPIDQRYVDLSGPSAICRSRGFDGVDLSFSEVEHFYNGSVWVKCQNFTEAMPLNNFVQHGYSVWIDTFSTNYTTKVFS